MTCILAISHFYAVFTKFQDNFNNLNRLMFKAHITSFYFAKIPAARNYFLSIKYQQQKHSHLWTQFKSFFALLNRVMSRGVPSASPISWVFKDFF